MSAVEGAEIAAVLEAARQREFWWFHYHQMPLLAFAARCGGKRHGSGGSAGANLSAADEAGEDYLCRSATSLMAARMMRTEESLATASFYAESRGKDGAAMRRNSTVIANQEARRHTAAVTRDVNVLRDFIGGGAMRRVERAIRRVCTLRWAMRVLLLLPSFDRADNSGYGDGGSDESIVVQVSLFY